MAEDRISQYYSSNSFSSKPTLVYNDWETEKTVVGTIEDELKQCHSFDFSVAFITSSGLHFILQYLDNNKNTKGRIITTDYLNFSEPAALRTLLRLPNIETRIYTKDNFHTKGYIFHKKSEESLIIGSSNITRDALSKNKEWNIFISSQNRECSVLIQTQEEFEKMWKDSTILTKEWVDEYEPKHIRASIDRNKKLFEKRYTDIIKPNRMQEEALINLSFLRNNGCNKALLVSATGTGKTYLSAFDVKNSGAKRVLFLVHREQILNDAKNSFVNILGSNIKTGKITGSSKDWDADFIFSTTQSMSKPETMKHFDPYYFDYIICDEAHHSISPHYRRIVDYFKPKFLLGMTATPERMDKGDIFQLFDHNIAYEIRLQDALKQEMLCPFHYYGITDIEINGKLLDEESSFNMLTSDERIKHIIEKADFYGYSGNRVKGLIFCRNKAEGKEISNKLNKNGLRTEFICDKTDQSDREIAVSRLEQNDNDGALDYLITVDIFNEGVDIKSVNQLILLRPTQSSTIFIQQLGRGLRKITRDNETKEYLVVIDFIGNYKNNYLIPMTLSGDSSMNKENLRRILMSGQNLIAGCSTVDFDRISEERIYSSINSTTDLTQLMKNEYKNMVKMLGFCPDLRYLLKTSKIDPVSLIKSYDNLNNFKTKLKLEHYNFDSEEENTLTFISKTFVNGIRPHESYILESLIENGSISIDSVKNSLFNLYDVNFDDDTQQSCINILNGSFSDKLNNSLIDVNDDVIKCSSFFETVLKNDNLKQSILDALECGIEVFQMRYKEKYDGHFSFFQRYSRADVCRLLNWKSEKESSTIYGYRVKNDTCPIFVTYKKDKSISKSTQYSDYFIDKQTFNWMTRNKVHIDGKEVTQIRDPKTKNYLFIQKGDDDSSDFYYLGPIDPIQESIHETTIENDKGEMLPIVNIQFKLRNPVPDGIYDYLTS